MLSAVELVPQEGTPAVRSGMVDLGVKIMHVACPCHLGASFSVRAC
jgi:hypothetical protein